MSGRFVFFLFKQFSASISADENSKNIARQGVNYASVLKSTPQSQEITSSPTHNLEGLLLLDRKHDARNDT